MLMTIARYDFTPLSVDEDRMGKLEVQENSGVSVSLPHNNGIDATQYKGGAKPAGTKDCILIIDHETGELTLERLSNQVCVICFVFELEFEVSCSVIFQILLKKTRAEKAEKHHGGGEGSSSSNPYLVKQEPEKPATSSYTVKREPDKPHGPRAPRPSTPQHKHKAAAAPASTGSPGHGVSSRGSPGAGAAARLPHSRGLSESSDSNSSSSSDSDSDSDSNASANEKSNNNCEMKLHFTNKQIYTLFMFRLSTGRRHGGHCQHCLIVLYAWRRE